mmetsp:Transcript_29751/g.81519  ORF Transcript_29751/g.81519 Transcript_29751/m.81519 type:complete len:233 (+) Transcript_29751:518-1216(+)
MPRLLTTSSPARATASRRSPSLEAARLASWAEHSVSRASNRVSSARPQAAAANANAATLEPLKLAALLSAMPCASNVSTSSAPRPRSCPASHTERANSAAALSANMDSAVPSEAARKRVAAAARSQSSGRRQARTMIWQRPHISSKLSPAMAASVASAWRDVAASLAALFPAKSARLKSLSSRMRPASTLPPCASAARARFRARCNGDGELWAKPWTAVNPPAAAPTAAAPR